jgi:hypothetical protein
MKVIADEGYFA